MDSESARQPEDFAAYLRERGSVELDAQWRGALQRDLSGTDTAAVLAAVVGRR